jgi:hypothetical protein
MSTASFADKINELIYGQATESVTREVHQIVKASARYLRPAGWRGRWPDKTLTFLIMCDLWQPDRQSQQQIWHWVQTGPTGGAGRDWRHRSSGSAYLDAAREAYSQILGPLTQAVRQSLLDETLQLYGEVAEAAELLADIGVIVKHPGGTYSANRQHPRAKFKPAYRRA